MIPRIHTLEHPMRAAHGASFFTSFLRREPMWELKSQAQLRQEEFPAGKRVLNYDKGRAISLLVKGEKLTDQLWPLLDEYHSHFRSLNYALELNRRLENRSLQLQLNQLAMDDRKDDVAKFIKNTVVESIYHSRGQEHDMHDKTAIRQQRISDTNSDIIRDVVTERAAYFPKLLKKRIVDPYETSVKPSNEVTIPKDRQREVEGYSDYWSHRDRISRMELELIQQGRLEDLRLLLAAHDYAFRYGLETILFNRQAIRMKGRERAGQSGYAVSQIARISMAKG